MKIKYKNLVILSLSFWVKTSKMAFTLEFLNLEKKKKKHLAKFCEKQKCWLVNFSSHTHQRGPYDEPAPTLVPSPS
jgi:hypothetical protein